MRLRPRFVATLAALALLAGACREDADSPVAPGAAGTQPSALTAAAALSFSQVSAGTRHTCGVTTGNVAYCWGENVDGQLGDGTRTRHPWPVKVAGGLRFLEVRAGGGHTCGVTTDNRAYCWGENSYGALGDGTTEPHRLTPTPVAGGRRWRQVSAGSGYSCGVTTLDVAFCWGDNIYRQLGAGTGFFFTRSPVRVAGTLKFRRVNAAFSHTCGATTNDRAYCWGTNTAGQLGDGSRTARATPVAVAGGVSFRQALPGSGYISGAGPAVPDYAYSCGVATDDRAYCWGVSYFGGSAKPVAVVGLRRFRYVNPGAFHTCGVTLSSVALCWGSNGSGQLGTGGASTETPTRVAGGLAWAGLTASAIGFHTCGVTTDHRAYCWGDNTSGQLGDGTTTGRPTPVPVAGPS
jgi:alpha-tubulin suppressor-like RCC1 family protein